MKYIILIIIIIIILTLLGVYLIYKNKQEKNKLNNVRINESLKNIEILMEEKEKYLEESINLIKNSNKKKYNKKDILDSLIKNKSKKLDLYEQYEELQKSYKEFLNLIYDDKKLQEDKKINGIKYKLNNIENDLNASIKYYNKYIVLSNNKATKFNIVKEEEFEILKEK